MPTFVYALRRWAIFMICCSFSKLASPFVPKKPLAGSSVWQPLQLKPAPEIKADPSESRLPV